ncbi:hypothetical protein ACFVYV_34690 [Streptomyces mirabilis]
MRVELPFDLVMGVGRCDAMSRCERLVGRWVTLHLAVDGTPSGNGMADGL